MQRVPQIIPEILTLLSIIISDSHVHFVFPAQFTVCACGMSKVEMPDGLWPLWAYDPHGPRAVFFFLLISKIFKQNKNSAYYSHSKSIPILLFRLDIL